MSEAHVSGNASRTRRYRTKHRRIDYVPADDVLPIIETRRQQGEVCMAGVIDDLIRAGHAAMVSGRKVSV